MSGDVQPKKRKDKKRRKDDVDAIPIQTPHVPLLAKDTSNDDVNIHVHKDSGTGGGFCAKFVFFVLFSALAVLIGLIITEHRGLTDLDTIDAESKYSQIFEGWVDSSTDHHDDHNIDGMLEAHDDNDDDAHAEDHEEEAEDLSTSKQEEEDNEYDEHNLSEEEEDEVEEEPELSEEKSVEEDQEIEDDDVEDTVEESNEREEDGDEEENYFEASEEQEREDSDNESEDHDDDDDEEDNEDDTEDVVNNEADLYNISEEMDSTEDDIQDEVSEETKSVEEDKEEENEIDNDDDEDNDIDDLSGENISIQQKGDNNAEEIEVKSASFEKQKSAPKRTSREVDEESEEKVIPDSDMAVKIGVGVAILVVAHLVLVKKWRNAKTEVPSEEPKEQIPDLGRRNTIVVPPTYQEVEPDIEQEDEDYSEDEISEDEARPQSKSMKTKYQELRTTYSRSLTPETELDDRRKLKNIEDEYDDNVNEEEEEEVSEEEEEEDEEEDPEESDNDEYDEDEEEELLKRLEAKYGKMKSIRIPKDTADDSDSERQSDDSTVYENLNISNKADLNIKDVIDEAHKQIEKNCAYAIKLFDKILQKYPSSPRSIYGKALALDYLADQRRSNELLDQALKLYTTLFVMEDVPKMLFEIVAERCINRMRFIGQYKNLITVHTQIINRFPENPKHRNDLAVTYLTINRVEEARHVLKKVLSSWPNDGFALVHYGFILKTKDNKLDEAVNYIKQGLKTGAEGVIDGRFYFHLGDALTRLGRNEEAMQVYEEGTVNKVLLSKYQRSLYNVPKLTAKPWWNPDELPFAEFLKKLKSNWKKIREEGLSVLNQKGYFQDESENLRDTGEWKQFELFARGEKNQKNCQKCPFTCSIIDQFTEARSCKRGQTKFSVMHPGTHVWPHCGPTNCRLRSHLGLKIPPKTFIRVANDTRSWKEGEIMVFDDSFEHEVWHNGSEFRLVLIVDVWHPDLTPSEKKNLSPI